ncbi:MAG: hypothetical protein ACJ76H_06420 [Bacteriovoracaceae bacterium]
MALNINILLEGSYFYFEKGINYSQENFKLVQQIENKNYQVISEVLSRIETGEFLKINVLYEMTPQFLPLHVRIEKSIGNNYALEDFKCDHHAGQLHYLFQNATSQQEFHRPITSRHYLSAPSFASSCLFSLSKKFDATGRTPVNFISSGNDWTYVSPPNEKIVYAEWKIKDMDDFKLGDASLSASHLMIYQNDSSNADVEQPVSFYVSKHFGIPYQMLHGDRDIRIQNLKKHF